MRKFSDVEIERRVAKKLPKNHPDFASAISNVHFRMYKYRRSNDFSINRVINSVLIDLWRSKKESDYSIETIFYLPDDSINNVETVIAFEEFLANKSLKERTIIIGRALGYTFEEIAECSNFTSQQCYKYYKNRWKRWRRELNKCLIPS